MKINMKMKMEKGGYIPYPVLLHFCLEGDKKTQSIMSKFNHNIIFFMYTPSATAV